MNESDVYYFVKESNKIEGIKREPTKEELAEFTRFMQLKEITIDELKKFVSIYQPNAQLRDMFGLNVRVGSYIAPPGGPQIYKRLTDILFNDANLNPWEQHIEYETLHPFTDGNGRSGRALWAWRMQKIPLGFLHMFYYQTLQNSEKRKK